MTAIVAWAVGGDVWVAGDGVGFDQTGSLQPRRDPKVFLLQDRNNQTFAIGVSGSFRQGQVIRHEFVPPLAPVIADPLTGVHPASRDAAVRYMVTEFVPALKRIIAENDEICSDDPTTPLPGGLLVCFHGHLFEVQGDYQVAEPTTDYWAQGTGAELCLGYLAATTAIDGPSAEYVQASLIGALKTAALFHGTVGPPYAVVRATTLLPT